MRNRAGSNRRRRSLRRARREWRERASQSIERNAPTGPLGVNPRAIERLADIDVAQTRDNPLIEQQQLDCRTSAGQPFPQFARIDVERFWPERLEGRPLAKLARPHEVERAEPARIVEGKPSPLVGLDDEMVVLGRSRSGRSASGPTCRGERRACRRGRCRSGRISRGGQGRSPARRSIAGQGHAGSARRRSGRRASTRSMRRPLRTRSRPRTVVSTSGSSRHAARAIWRRLAQAPLEAASPMSGQGQFRRRTRQPRGEDAARRRSLQLGRAPLRRHERPHVGRHAPVLERPFRQSGEATAGEVILDMAGGTGDIAFRMAGAAPG